MSRLLRRAARVAAALPYVWLVLAEAWADR